jgi:transcriptional regulator GlxA family with amidase domain
MEFIFTASFLSWAIAVVLVGMFSPQAMDLLIPAQTIMLSMAIAAAIHIQLNYPHLLSSLEEIASRQYQTSTLLDVDCEDVKQRLEALMSVKRAYQDSELSLSSLSEMLSLKPHQLSELINTQLGMGFSSYLRNQRVKAAEVLLKTEPEVSVLAIGLTVGFNSQSAFYSAFKEFHSIAPGQYRRQTLAE